MTKPADPPISDALRAEARRRPGAMLYSIDPAFDPAGEVPPYGVIGCFQVDHYGTIIRFINNPNYIPSPQARGWRRPENPAEMALQRAAAGHGSEEDLVATLLDTPLLLFAQPGHANLYVLPGQDGRDVLEACTSPHYVPVHWPGTALIEGRRLAEMTTGLELRINPGSAPSATIPVDALLPRQA